MKIEIAFAGESARRHRTGYHLLRIPSGPHTQFVCTSSRPTVIHYHRHNEQQFIHTRPVCICHEFQLPCRERGYIGGKVARRDQAKGFVWEDAILELSAGALTDLDVLFSDYRNLRGAHLQLSRKLPKLNSQLLAVLKRFEDEARLGPALDVMAFVHELWREFLPPVAIPKTFAVDDRVSWDDPGSEIPC